MPDRPDLFLERIPAQRHEALQPVGLASTTAYDRRAVAKTAQPSAPRALSLAVRCFRSLFVRLGRELG